MRVTTLLDGVDVGPPKRLVCGRDIDNSIYEGMKDILNVKKLFKDSKWKSKFKLYKCVIPSPRMSRLRYFSSL